jgi:hypothetical protein
MVRTRSIPFATVRTNWKGLFVDHFSLTTKYRKGQVKKGEKYQYFPRIYFSISVQGGNQMDIKIEKKRASKVAGIKSDVTKSSNFLKVWDRLVEKVPREKLEEFGNF